MTTTEILPTQNEGWGFFGTMSSAGQNAEATWNEAFRQIAEETGCSSIGIRGFLDSRDGRHFADSVVGGFYPNHTLEQRIAHALRDWQKMKITSRMERKHGIPAGLPYITGWCAHYEIEAENNA